LKPTLVPAWSRYGLRHSRSRSPAQFRPPHAIFAAPTAFHPTAKVPIVSESREKTEIVPVPGEKLARRRGVALVLAATVLWSMAGLFARLVSHLDVWTVLGWRALFGATSIAVVGLIEWRRGRLNEPFAFGRLSPFLALLAMIAISAYAASVMTTTIADVMIIYATLPFVAAGIGWLVNREPVSARTLAASAMALAGIAIMVASGLGSGRMLGQALSALMTLSFAGMIVMQRRQPGASIIPVNAFGALGSGLFGLLVSSHPSLDLYDFAVLFVFGLTTIGFAFVLFMEGAKFIPSAEAGLISLLDVVLGPMWVFLAFGENPGAPTILSGAIVLAAALWRMAPDLRREQVL
jgi:drug/metabolite transporter (DMT)-like permease